MFVKALVALDNAFGGNLSADNYAKNKAKRQQIERETGVSFFGGRQKPPKP